MKTIVPVLLFACILFASCRKESFITSPDAIVTITADTLKYDTVFVTTGSITQTFKIINNNDRKLRLSSVKLMGGAASSYKINVDGFTGPEATNLEIEANDSIYVFVQVNIDQSTANLPFIIRDSIQVSYNGNNEKVQLEAWGQNAHFFRNKQVLANETWNNDKPYVILGYLYIDTSQTLTINKGCRIYMHADAPIIVDGTLVVNGQKDTADRVYFRGDRIRDFPAAWPGIYFFGSSINNVMNYAVIKNGYQSIGVQDPSANANPKLTLNECIIDNAYDAGIIAINSSIRARNCLVSNCGKNVYLVKGGNYDFTHCTVATISNSFIQHREPVLTVADVVNNSAPNPLTASFVNCIFWGENGIVDDEVEIFKTPSNPGFNVSFNQVLWKVTANPSNITIVPPAPINGQAPVFDSINTSRNYYSFRLKPGPGVNGGTNAGVTIDLDGKSRPVGIPDLGCYERQP
jgi:hypothetical protein